MTSFNTGIDLLESALIKLMLYMKKENYQICVGTIYNYDTKLSCNRITMFQ